VLSAKLLYFATLELKFSQFFFDPHIVSKAVLFLFLFLTSLTYLVASIKILSLRKYWDPFANKDQLSLLLTEGCHGFFHPSSRKMLE